MPKSKGNLPTTQPSLPTGTARDVASIRRSVPKALRTKLANDPTHYDIKMALEFLKLFDPILQPIAPAVDLEPEKIVDEADVALIEGVAELVQEAPANPHEDILSKLPFQDEKVNNRPERSFDLGRDYTNEDN